MTERGPVISDVFAGIFKTDVVSFRYVPPDETLILSLFELPRAKSMQLAQQAAGRLNSQPRVFLVSAQDRTLLFYTGKVPVRAFPDRIFKKDAGWPPAMDLPANPQFTADDTLITGNDIFETEPALIKNYIQFNDKSRAARLRDLLESAPVLDERRIESILFDTYSATASRYIPVIMPVLQKIPVTSARLSRMYFNDWDFHMRRESVPAMVFHALLIELMRETMADEFKNEMEDLIGGHYFLAEKLYDTFSADKSMIFDDVTTKDKVEFRDMIFDRAFLKTMRFLNSRRGPIMEAWTWGSLHQGRFAIPLVKGSFITRRQYRSEDVPVSGGFSTLHKGSYDARRDFRASGVTACSGIISAEKMLISGNFGCSMNPASEYFSQYRESRRFVPLGMSAPERVMVLVPKK
jgi:acyl-homoserine lactone acylase PvdQ